MISYFPKPYHDEVLYSTIARYQQWSGNTTARQTMRELFANADSCASVVLPLRLGTLAAQTEAFGMSFDMLLLDHTLYPYYTAFSRKETADHVCSVVRNGIEGHIYVEMGLFSANTLHPKHLRFCPECFAEELRHYGQGYWRRLHQTPGVLLCEKHHSPLLETRISYQALGSNAHVPAALDRIFPAVCPPSLTALAVQQAVQIAEDIRYLYENYGRIRKALDRHQYSFRNLYLHLLREKGLAADGGSLRLEEFRRAFLAYFATDFLEALKLSFDDSIVRPWIVSMCRGKSDNVHPLRHLLMARFLCGGISRLIELAETCDIGSIYGKRSCEWPKTENHDEKLKQYRAKWLAACDAMPGACQNDIRKTAEAVYTWLNRHDKEWLKQHPKERMPRGGNPIYADWAERDRRYSARVERVAERIRALPGKPVRVSKTKLLREIGCGGLPSRLYDNLPLTMAAVRLVEESQQDFRQRAKQLRESVG